MNAPQPSGTATCSLRVMTEVDIDPARALWGEAEGVELAEGDSPAEIAAYLRRNPGASQVAVAEGRLVGAVLAGHDGRRGFLYHLAVARSHRGRGLGRALVGRSLETLRREGVRRVLILVARDNDGGRAFWRGCGWDPLDAAEPLGIDL
jgi:ribosomal protein S18 acetylase RimI-like enzyme